MRLVFSSTSLSPGHPAIFIDRDGVINLRRAGDYVLHWDQFVFTPGIREALRGIARLGLPLIVISNQSAVGRGLLSRSTLEVITRNMHQKLKNHGVSLLAVYYCTHKPQDECVCRKPHPELLLKAAEDFSVDMSKSVFIGDSDADIRAAEAAGCQPVLFGPGLTACSTSPEWKAGIPVATTARHLPKVVVRLLKQTALQRA
jgi:D-glycero-D-manno-heptose 1,7-bisphosphate phosphatase